MLDLGVGPAARRPVGRNDNRPSITSARSQLCSVWPSGTSNGGSRGAISASLNALFAEFRAAATAMRMLANSRPSHSPTGCAPLVGASQHRPPSPGSCRARIAAIAAASRARPDRRWPRWRRAHPGPRRQCGQLRVALAVDGMAVVGQFDADPVRSEAVTRSASASAAASGPPFGNTLTHMAFATSGQDVPVRRRPGNRRRSHGAAFCSFPPRPGGRRPADGTAADIPGSAGDNQQTGRAGPNVSAGGVDSDVPEHEHRREVEFAGPSAKRTTRRARRVGGEGDRS